MMDISPYAIIVFMSGVILSAILRKVDCFSAFATGAKEGLKVCIRVLPTMAAMLVAVAVMRQSGLLDYIVKLLEPAALAIGVPAQALPLAVIRPFSGGAALAVLADILAAFGPDSPTGIAACIIMGSSETLFYTTALYFGSRGITKWRYTIPAALVSSVVGVLCAGWLC